MSGRRRIAFWTLLVGSVVAGAWWFLHVPYSSGWLYRAIPADAVVVSVHHDLAARWDIVAQNPLVTNLFAPDDKASGEGVDLRDPQVSALLEQLASRQLVAAYVPALGYSGEPAWVFSSWVGGRSQVMRWMLNSGKLPQFEPLELPVGEPCWMLHSAVVSGGATLSVTVVEGALIGCISRDPMGIGHVLDVFEGRSPSLASVGGAETEFLVSRESAALDYGWVRVADFNPALIDVLPVLGYELSEVTAGGVTGHLSAPGEMLHNGSVAEQVDRVDLERWLGNLPLAFLAAGPATAVELLDASVLPVWTRVAEELLLKQNSGPVVVTALGGDYSGRYLGIKVPTLLAAAKVADSEEAVRRMGYALDRLNSHYRWGLVPRETSVGRHRVYALESTVGKGLARLLRDELPAYALCDGWLLVASNLGALTKLVLRFDEQKTDNTNDAHGWMDGLAHAGWPAYGWIDLQGSAKTVRAAIRFYSIKLYLSHPRDSDDARRTLDDVLRWVDALAPFGTARLWLGPGNGRTELKIKLGEAP